jgi:hypothetical protein
MLFRVLRGIAKADDLELRDPLDVVAALVKDCRTFVGSRPPPLSTAAADHLVGDRRLAPVALPYLSREGKESVLKRVAAALRGFHPGPESKLTDVEVAVIAVASATLPLCNCEHLATVVHAAIAVLGSLPKRVARDCDDATWTCIAVLLSPSNVVLNIQRGENGDPPTMSDFFCALGPLVFAMCNSSATTGGSMDAFTIRQSFVTDAARCMVTSCAQTLDRRPPIPPIRVVRKVVRAGSMPGRETNANVTKKPRPLLDHHALLCYADVLAADGDVPKAERVRASCAIQRVPASPASAEPHGGAAMSRHGSDVSEAGAASATAGQSTFFSHFMPRVRSALGKVYGMVLAAQAAIENERLPVVLKVENMMYDGAFVLAFADAGSRFTLAASPTSTTDPNRWANDVLVFVQPLAPESTGPHAKHVKKQLQAMFPKHGRIVHVQIDDVDLNRAPRRNTAGGATPSVQGTSRGVGSGSREAAAATEAPQEKPLGRLGSEKDPLRESVESVYSIENATLTPRLIASHHALTRLDDVHSLVQEVRNRPGFATLMGSFVAAFPVVSDRLAALTIFTDVTRHPAGLAALFEAGQRNVPGALQDDSATFHKCILNAKRAHKDLQARFALPGNNDPEATAGQVVDAVAAAGYFACCTDVPDAVVLCRKTLIVSSVAPVTKSSATNPHPTFDALLDVARVEVSADDRADLERAVLLIVMRWCKGHSVIQKVFGHGRNKMRANQIVSTKEGASIFTDIAERASGKTVTDRFRRADAAAKRDVVLEAINVFLSWLIEEGPVNHVAPEARLMDEMRSALGDPPWWSRLPCEHAASNVRFDPWSYGQEIKCKMCDDNAPLTQAIVSGLGTDAENLARLIAPDFIARSLSASTTKVAPSTEQVWAAHVEHLHLQRSYARVFAEQRHEAREMRKVCEGGRTAFQRAYLNYIDELQQDAQNIQACIQHAHDQSSARR